MKNTFLQKLALIMVLLVFSSSSAIAGKITVYTSYEEDEAKAFLDLAKKDLPNIEVSLLRLSTGDLAARIIAESKNPRHDVIWGFAATSMVNSQIYKLLEAYKPANLNRLDAKFIDKGNRWFAVTGYMAAFCVNNERLSEKGLKMPRSWADLTDPAYKGEVVMPNPASSGTGYIQINSLLQLKGNKKGWKFLDALDKNIAQYIKSGSKPCHSASAGEYTVGASYALRAIKNIDAGSPITMVIPAEGAGNELEVNGLMKKARNKKDAKAFLDWTLSQNAVNEYPKWKAIVSVPGGAVPDKFTKAGLPDDIASSLFKVNYSKAGSERDAILSEWQKRYER